MRWANADEARRDVCGDKIPLTAKGARAVAVQVTTQNPRHDRPMAPYKCPFCGAWHIGHLLSVEGMRALANVLRGFDSEGNPIPTSQGSTP